MKTEYDANAAFLYPNMGEQERRFFYALMLRNMEAALTNHQYPI